MLMKSRYFEVFIYQRGVYMYLKECPGITTLLSISYRTGRFLHSAVATGRSVEVQIAASFMSDIIFFKCSRGLSFPVPYLQYRIGS